MKQAGHHSITNMNNCALSGLFYERVASPDNGFKYQWCCFVCNMDVSGYVSKPHLDIEVNACDVFTSFKTIRSLISISDKRNSIATELIIHDQGWGY